MKKALVTVVGLAAMLVSGVASAECVIHYKRTACVGKEAESFKKCDGNAECDKTKEAADAQSCQAAALKSCDNDRLDITKYKEITAKFGGKDLVGGFDAMGNPDPAGLNFCDKNRADLNKCD